MIKSQTELVIDAYKGGLFKIEYPRVLSEAILWWIEGLVASPEEEIYSCKVDQYLLNNDSSVDILKKLYEDHPDWNMWDIVRKALKLQDELMKEEHELTKEELTAKKYGKKLGKCTPKRLSDGHDEQRLEKYLGRRSTEAERYQFHKVFKEIQEQVDLGVNNNKPTDLYGRWGVQYKFNGDTYTGTFNKKEDAIIILNNYRKIYKNIKFILVKAKEDKNWPDWPDPHKEEDWEKIDDPKRKSREN